MEFLCPGCGNVLQGDSCPHCDDRLIYRILQREVWLLLLLSLIALPIFFVTRALAHRLHADQLRGAAVWYARGDERLQAGDTLAAVRYFRRAASADHENLNYSLALAQALSRMERFDEAQRLLLQLREQQPEDAGINLQLGRLAARQGDISRAVLNYHHALYGRWPEGEPAATRIAVRKELIRLLLLHHQNSTAVSELLLLVPELPEAAADLAEAGQMFLTADDPQRARTLFLSALKLDRAFAAAYAGAGEASFRLADYPAARRYWQQVPDLSPRLRALREVAELVMARDPQLPRLTEAQRTERLIRNLEAALGHLDACTAKPDVLDPLRAEGKALRATIKPGDVVHDSAAIDIALGWVKRAETVVVQNCGTGPLQEALLVISQRTGGGVSP